MTTTDQRLEEEFIAWWTTTGRIEHFSSYEQIQEHAREAWMEGASAICRIEQGLA